MLRWIFGHIRRDVIRNKTMQDKVGMALMADKMMEAGAEMVRPCEEEA